MRIALDAMGGDFAPKVAVEGAILAKNSLPAGCEIILLGPQDTIESLLSAAGVDKGSFVIHHSPQVIEMAENPTKAFQQKQESSIANGFKLLAMGKADAFCSAGNTGAMMVGSIFTIKPIKGVIRPVIAGFFPQFSGKYGIMV
ncbi:MAG: phosphate--acyl-ACP acyltransferase, partial [Cytophagales bacterium]|nr:phosphate--acyl-ACP acyltransferase [Cytophagales bacterium]